jgi:excisionase family DNA binding protein
MPDRTAGQQPELLTIAEAAEVLRTPVATLRYWRHLGTGPRSFRLGRRVVYRRDDLHAWIDSRRGDAVPTDAKSAARGPGRGLEPRHGRSRP